MHAVHPIRAELGKPSDMRSAVQISMVICTAIYVAVGLFGYLLFGDSIMADMLVNFDQNSDSTKIGQFLNDIVRLSYAIHIVLVYPVINFTLRTNIDELLFPKKPDLATDTPRFVSLTCVLLALTYIVAIVIPDIWYLFQFLGSTTIVCLSFIFPGAIILRYYNQQVDHLLLNPYHMWASCPFICPPVRIYLKRCYPPFLSL